VRRAMASSTVGFALHVRASRRRGAGSPARTGSGRERPAVDRAMRGRRCRWAARRKSRDRAPHGRRPLQCEAAERSRREALGAHDRPLVGEAGWQSGTVRPRADGGAAHHASVDRTGRCGVRGRVRLARRDLRISPPRLARWGRRVRCGARGAARPGRELQRKQP
jgi:hypothetical protein